MNFVEEKCEKYSASDGNSQSSVANWIDCGIPERRIGSSFPSISILGAAGITDLLDLEVRISSGGAGADKLDTDAGNGERVGDEEDDCPSSVVILASESFGLKEVETVELSSEGISVDEGVVSDVDVVAEVVDVTGMTLGKGGALQ